MNEYPHNHHGVRGGSATFSLGKNTTNKRRRIGGKQDLLSSPWKVLLLKLPRYPVEVRVVHLGLRAGVSAPTQFEGAAGMPCESTIASKHESINRAHSTAKVEQGVGQERRFSTELHNVPQAAVQQKHCFVPHLEYWGPPNW